MNKGIAMVGLVCLFFGCSTKKLLNATLFVSNVSSDRFDQTIFKVFVDDVLVITDTVKNQYLSFHWKESKINVPQSKFNLKTSVSGVGYSLERDTLLQGRRDLKLFVRFNFQPFYKRYRNPDIYRYLPRETTRFKEMADSLYARNVLPNANEYLNDTIPLRKNIEISCNY